ncbi:MAG: oxidoreductase [Flavobacteriaceae bacterium]
MTKTTIIIMALVLLGCSSKEKSANYSSVAIETVFSDSIRIRAIEFLDDQTLAFAGNKGVYGSIDVRTNTVRTNVQKFDSILPEFRAVAHTKNDFFMLSVATPALLYKTGEKGKMELVYKEEGEGVFYDSMRFWNDLEGIAIGDGANGCLSIIITRDGGNNWVKVPCDSLPSLDGSVGAYAASNTNIEIVGDTCWIITAMEDLLFSEDKGKTWTAIEIPILITEPYQGIYSIDFYDENLGYGIGGSFEFSDLKKSNKMITTDGGETWELIAEGQEPGYKSCVQFMPNSGGKDMVAVGFTGISYSNNGGHTWKSLSEEGFYTIRFLNSSTAYAAGKNRIARLVFK